MIVLFTLIVTITALVITVILNSPGTPKPYMDQFGQKIKESISEKGSIIVDGYHLYYFIKGRNIHNPVLLYLHGGMPDYFLTEKYPTGLDDIFTVVWLEQRGAGSSYEARYPEDDKIIDTLISDVQKVTLYLSKRFAQDRIYLMGHSGGTFLGVKVIERHPELYKAYIGVAQISYQKLSEKKAYEYIRDRYKNDPQRKKIYETLLKYPVESGKAIPEEYAGIRDGAMHELGIGTMRKMKDVVTGIFIPSLLFKEYSLVDKINLWKGKANSGISILWDEMMNHNLADESTDFKVPFYILHGVYDYTCSYELSKDYFAKINAPEKGFYSFSNSAHSPIFEEPAECIKVIKENILK